MELAMKNDGKLPIYEIFYSMQGEGVFMGRAAFFVRLYGCDQKCPWCDSAGTWHPQYKPTSVPQLMPQQIVQRCREANVAPGAFVVLTGGEPALYPLDPLIHAFWDEGRQVHIETAGHRPLPKAIDWITLSPKVFLKAPLRENIQRANEFKIIVSDEKSLGDALDTITPHCRDNAAIWLHPEWSKRSDPAVLALIVESVKKNPRLRAGYQLHKLYSADFLDPLAVKASIPLGGEISRGSAN